jgi:hypothetical protein
MKVEGIILLMVLLGGFSFMGFGMMVANSNLSKIEETVCTILAVIGAISFVSGLVWACFI